ncbi:Phospholipase B1 membrane-associated [Trichostrongylus colubriformis]|uniref:Phospholipase B1 membrane-associated n=1 Tax=Trichostrongylus colubriformis TaxID=6319 RepID=A0AAN8FA29_TRICO
MSLPSLDKMLRVFNPSLTVIQSNERDDSLREQARTIAESIQELKGYENVWKLILIAATIQDGEASESRQTAVEVLEAIEELHRQLPLKTFIAVLRTSGNGIWSDATHSHIACQDMLSMWKTHSKYNSMSVWDQMETIVAKNYRNSEFTVEVLPLLRESALTNLPDQMDLSVLGYDCAHFSERGLSLLHIAIWNSLFTKSADRLRQYRPVAPPLLCPDFRCPFLRTVTNSGFCIWKEPLVAEETSIYPKLITLCVLVFCLVLAVAVLFFVCRKPRGTKDIKKPAKSFGASLSSIKFIDEDAV